MSIRWFRAAICLLSSLSLDKSVLLSGSWAVRTILSSDALLKNIRECPRRIDSTYDQVSTPEHTQIQKAGGIRKKLQIMGSKKKSSISDVFRL